MVEYSREDDGTWAVAFSEHEIRDSDDVFRETLPRYLTALDPAFARARERCECEFVKALLRITSMQDEGWFPYDTTLRAIPAMVRLHALIPSGDEYYETSRHLALWTYGHVIEASEPYSILADMLDIAAGGWFKGGPRFPDIEVRRPGEGETEWNVPARPQRFLDEKLPELERLANAAALSEILEPIREIWDRDLRNAVVHADYTIHGGETRIPRLGRVYSHEEIQALVNRALAYHRAMEVLQLSYARSYTEPVSVLVHPDVAREEGESMVVMIREGDGAIGLRYVYTREQVAAGAIAAHIAKLHPDEAVAVLRDPTLVVLPARE